MPSYPKPEDILYYAGKTLTVEWYYAENGKLPGLEYYRRMPENDQERLDHMVHYLADTEFGTTLPQVMYRIEDRQQRIFAFKPGAQRFFNFMTVGGKIIITNAYRKHSQRMTRQDLRILQTAVNFRSDYLRRVKEGTYYEKR